MNRTGGYAGKPLKLSRYGSRLRRHSDLDKEDSLFDKSYLGVILTLFFTFGDFITLKSLFNTVSTDNPFTIWLITLVSAVLLDFSPSKAATVRKKYEVGLVSKEHMKHSFIVAGIFFLLPIALMFYFRMVAKDITFNLAGTATLTSMNVAQDVSQNTSGDKVTGAASLYYALLPLVTSGFSYAFTYMTYDPISLRLRRLKRFKLKTENHISEVRQVIFENEGMGGYCEAMLRTETALFDEFKASVQTQLAELKCLVRSTIAAECDDADDISILIASSLAESKAVMNDDVVLPELAMLPPAENHSEEAPDVEEN